MEGHLSGLEQKKGLHLHPRLEVRSAGLGSSQNLAVLQQQDLLQTVPMETMDRDVESSSWS